MLHVEDKRLVLPDGRTLAYADNGNTSSSTVILFLHGAFGVGDASHPPPVILKKNLHFVAPSLPGWGHSSPVPSNSYASTFISDITALLNHLHPKTTILKLYICGHSFGTIPAQVLYGASYDKFPFGQQIAGLILVAPHSPPHCHKEYARSLSWCSYFMTGPPTCYMPFNPVSRLAMYILARKLRNIQTAEEYVRTTIFARMSDIERDVLAHWQADRGIAETGLQSDMAVNMIHSVSKTWRGFLDIPYIYHYGWGDHDPAKLDIEHSKPPVLVISGETDQMAPRAMAEWIVANYKNATHRPVEGGHIAGFVFLDQVWNEILEEG